MPWGSVNRHAALQHAELLARAVDFPFSLIGNGLEGFYRCDSLITDGFTISQINDQSGNGRHAVQASGALQPDYDPINFSRAAAAFGGGPYLAIPGGLASAMPADNWTIWVAAQAASDTDDMGIFSVGATGGVAVDAESGNWTVRAKGVGLATDGAVDTVSPHLVALTRTSGTMQLYIDGAEVSLASANVSVGAPSGTSSIGSVAGAVFVWLGWFLECGAVSGVLTAGELARLYDYYVTYYNPQPP